MVNMFWCLTGTEEVSREMIALKQKIITHNMSHKFLREVKELPDSMALRVPSKYEYITVCSIGYAKEIQKNGLPNSLYKPCVIYVTKRRYVYFKELGLKMLSGQYPNEMVELSKHYKEEITIISFPHVVRIVDDRDGGLNKLVSEMNHERTIVAECNKKRTTRLMRTVT